LENEKVLVTGGGGFIGSALVRALLSDGKEVIVYDSFVYGDRSNIAEIEKDVTVVVGDILSWKLENALKDNVQKVYHLAAEPYIPYSYVAPERFIEVNVLGAFKVLMACKLFGVEKVIHFSSSEIYGSAQHIPMDENHPTLPHSTYAVTKLAADRLCYTLAHEQKIPVIILRPFNCYGPRESQPYVIPEIIRQLVRSPKLTLGNLEARRDFTYVDDSVRAAIMVMEADLPAGMVVNVGSNISYSVRELVQIIAGILGCEDVKIELDARRFRPLEVNLLQCDYSKLRSLTGWEPRISIKEGLRLTIDWYKNAGCWPWEQRIH